MNIPKDPVILLSYVNTQLRDHFPTLEDFCKSCDISMDLLVESLAAIHYAYDESQNQFI